MGRLNIEEAIDHGESLAGQALAMRTEIFGPEGKE
jgi:hypothetical protein